MDLYDEDKHCVALLRKMNPKLRDETFVFCSTRDRDVVASCAGGSLMIFKEDEGFTLILKREDAERRGLDCGPPMKRIVLEVFSALTAVGLTAAVSSALAEENIPCNVVAAFHHDHVFVPEPNEVRAIEVLRAIQARANL